MSEREKNGGEYEDNRETEEQDTMSGNTEENEYIEMTYGEAAKSVEGYEDDELVYTRKKPIIYTVSRERVKFHRLIWWGAFILALLVISGAYMISSTSTDLLLTIFAVAIGVACVVGAWKIWMGLYVDYKYTMRNGYLEIQKILSGRKAVPLAKFDCKRITSLTPYDGSIDRQRFHFVLEACISPNDLHKNNTWCIEMKDRLKGDTLIYFNPNDEILEAIRARMNEHDEVFDGQKED